MQPVLSVITPAFNCDQTIEQALSSVFTQNLEVPFEVVVVDDGSSDKTAEVVRKLQKQHSEIKFYQHSSNKGGGAARNTAISHSKGTYIFCLDSDDVLGENMLPPMIKMIQDKKCDGVGIHWSKKFSGTNVHKIAYVTEMGHAGSRVPFESLLVGSTCPLYSTFLHTREAYDICEGYPEHHGFDTQSLAFRFLSNGLVAYTCADTVYMHRVNFHRSYYIREYEAGKVSENWLSIFEEFLFLFSDEVKQKLLEREYKGISSDVLELVRQNPHPFAASYKQFILPHAKTKMQARLLKKGNEVSAYDAYWLGNESFMKQKYPEAQRYFELAITKGLNSPRAEKKLLFVKEKIKGTILDESYEAWVLPKPTLIDKVSLYILGWRNAASRFVLRHI